MYVSKSMTFPTPHKGHSRHGLFFTRPDCQSNANPSEKDHDLLGTFGVAVSIPFSSSILNSVFTKRFIIYYHIIKTKLKSPVLSALQS
jgi:hypothetical protein